jgi:hypothetical protein
MTFRYYISGIFLIRHADFSFPKTKTMFKKTQNYLLINHPLLWNIKVVPLAIFLILCNIIFFILGYVNGAIDFTETNTRFRSDVDDIVIFFSITIMILTLIIWLVNYFKNNAFKSYYPKNNFSIFKEWIITLIVCMMLLSFPMSYFLAKDVRVRSYYTEQEARERTEILSLTSLFTTGSFKQSDYETKDSAGVILDVLVADIEYRGKKYPLSSLLNKNIKTFGFNDKEADSILRNRGLDWLVNNQKDSVLHLFDKFFELADEHHLKGNISSEKWLKLTYNYPYFTI